jgi:hypothetical protein
MVDNEIRRLTHLLEALVRVKKLPVREVERRLGYAGGTMNRIFGGKIELKVRHILSVLEILDVAPAAFFQIAYEKGTENATVEQILGRLERMGLAGPLEPKEPAVTPEDLRRTITEVLQELGVMGAAPAAKVSSPTKPAASALAQKAQKRTAAQSPSGSKRGKR